MRSALVAVALAACASSSPRPAGVAGPVAAETAAGSDAPAPPAEPVDESAWREGPAGFPVPVDADNGTRVLGDEADVTFAIQRERDVVYRALVAKLAASGFVVDDEKLVLGGHRMHVHRADQRWFVSVTENGAATLLTITVK